MQKLINSVNTYILLFFLQPRRRVKSAKARVMYLAPKPKQKPTVEEEEVLVKERLYKLEVFTSDHFSAGTDANVSPLQAHIYHKDLRTVICLSIGTPKNNKFSICSKWKIYYF